MRVQLVSVLYRVVGVKWMLTISFRMRPGNTEWQYKTVVSHKPPEEWLADRMELVELGEVPRLDVNILYAREIGDEAADLLDKRLNARAQGD